MYNMMRLCGVNFLHCITVEQRYTNLHYNDIPDIMINVFKPGQCLSKMYVTIIPDLLIQDTKVPPV